MVMLSSQPKDQRRRAAALQNPKRRRTPQAKLRTAIRGGFSKFYAFTFGGVQAYDALEVGEKREF